MNKINYMQTIAVPICVVFKNIYPNFLSMSIFILMFYLNLISPDNNFLPMNSKVDNKVEMIYRHTSFNIQPIKTLKTLKTELPIKT